MDTKTPPMVPEKGAALPLPSSAASPAQSTRKTYLLRLARLAVLVPLAYWTLNTLAPSRHEPALQAHEMAEVDGYLRAVVERGWETSAWTEGMQRTGKNAGVVDEQVAWVREAESDGVETKHHKHHHVKHKHDKKKHDHHGKHKHGHEHHGKHGHSPPRRPMPPLSPAAAEELFLTIPSNSSVAAASKRYTSRPHMAGTGNDALSALMLKQEWEELLGVRVTGPGEQVYDAGTKESQRATRMITGKEGGNDEPKVWVDTYYPLMNTPVKAEVSILGAPTTSGPRTVEWSARLREDIVSGDPTSIYRDEIPIFHGLSVSGDVIGKIVYAGYGRKSDFDALIAAGVDLKGTIALVKYGGVFRGLKVKAAAEAGAVGCLIYSDPGDDGEKTVKNGYEQYPEGPARQENSAQRGSVQYLSIYPGDPCTPGTPAHLPGPDAPECNATNMPTIPSLPISYADALPLLESLVGRGKQASDIAGDWVGGLEGAPHGLDAYWTGPSEVDVHFVNEVDTKITPIWNTMAVIPGHIKDEVVVMGNHRDAWVLGGADPSSGTATQYEIMRGFSALLKKGWKPLRTIMMASWDAEEYGLIGSVEHTEDFYDWIQEYVVAYLNLDVSVAGSNFHGSASPSLALLLKAAAQQIEHPTDPERSLWEMRDGGADLIETASDDFDALFASKTGIGALGSGSDYTAYLERYGIASTDMGYGGGRNDPAYHYHSIYDSHTWQALYGDPGFHKHSAAAQVLGLMILRVADGITLPLNVTQYTVELGDYVSKVEAISESMDAQVNLTTLYHAVNTVQDAAADLDKEKHAALKKLADLVPHSPRRSCSCCNGSTFRRAVFRVKHMLGMKSHKHKHHSPMPHLPPKKLKQIRKVLFQLKDINSKLAKFESGFISEEGLKERSWYRHLGTAPGLWKGYGSTTLPSITEALEIDHSPEEAQVQADKLAIMIKTMAEKLRA